jgi:pyruvate dehydrogenase E2 component (dihydrolipoamide acetyltransferase)
MAVELFIHKMSEHMQTARIVQWLVKEGETVQQFQILMEVETDKATAELESPASGVLKGVRPGAVDGAEVEVGQVIAYIAAPDEAVPDLVPLAMSTSGAVEAVSKVLPPPPSGEGQGGFLPPLPSGEGQGGFLPPLPLGEGRGEGLRATPVARRVAKELGVDLSRVRGTGPEGRIKEEDVRAYAEAATHGVIQPVEHIPSSSIAQTTTFELTSIQLLTGQRMLESVQTAPQFALTLSADMTQALRLREAIAEQPKAEGALRPSITAILVKVVAEALKHHPRANATFKEGQIAVYQHINIGIALGNAAELVVPVIRDADQKSLAQVARQIEAFQEKGKHMRFTVEDLSGGTFTLSNLGMYGIERFNAILIPGQSAILAAGRIVKTPVCGDEYIDLEDGTIALRPLIHLTLTVDHRVLDGVQGALFLSEIKHLLENPCFMI